MKTGFYPKLILILLCILCFSCSPESGGGGTNPPDPDPDPITTQYFTKRVLVEDYTGVWCDNCPRVAYAIEQFEGISNNVVTVAIHRQSSDPQSSSYDPFNFDASTIEYKLSIYGSYPVGMLDHSTKWNYPQPENIDQATDLLEKKTAIGITIEPIISIKNELSATIRIKFGKDFKRENLKLVAYVLEDGLIYDQDNNTEYYGGQKVIKNYVHNDVLRYSFTDLLGQKIPKSEALAEETYRTVLTTKLGNIPFSKKENLRVVVFVINDSNTALNVRSASLDEKQEFIML